MEYIIVPEVNAVQEFIEISSDFSNPLDLVREAISNAFDAKATEIELYFNVIKEHGNSILEIKIRDNGTGMDEDGLKSFFDLGNSLRRKDPNTIGEKGHGTKVYFNSSNIQVRTKKGNSASLAVMKEPITLLHKGEIPKVSVSKIHDSDLQEGTEIIILGYNKNARSNFTHAILKDYIIWFTKFGSIELQFDVSNYRSVHLHLKGLDAIKPEKMNFGHVFPTESKSPQKLFDDYLVRASDYYCKKFKRTGNLKKYPEISFQSVFYVEGNKIKQSYNPMVRRQGYQAPEGAYTVAERYGLWLCKDYLPIQSKNEWISYKGTEFTKFHAFFNCQELRLTANRGSIENTPSDILESIKQEVKDIYDEIINSSDWRDISWLEEEAGAYNTKKKEKEDFDWRLRRINKSNVAYFEGVELVEPTRESGVFALLVQLLTIKPDSFPFQILDYDTHSGYDIIAKGNKNLSIRQSKLYYLELKYVLTTDFNHSFDNLINIICWDTQLKHDDSAKDISGEERKLVISPRETNGDYTKYFLDNPRTPHKIEVFVLKDYLREKLGIEFRPRAKNQTV